MISIIIPVYNGEKTIINTVKSIESQTYRDFEVIIVNDGSRDNTRSVFEKFLESFKVENNYYFINQENKGAPAARNKGFKESRGEYLFFCDADAVLKNDTLEKMVQVLESNQEVAYTYSSFYWGKKLFKLWPFDAEKLQKMPYIHTMSLIRRNAFPGWDESVKKLQDWDLWLTMLENGHQGFFIDEALFKIKPGGTISSWLPAFAYKAFPFLPSVKKYNRALKIIKDKHNLN
ncbi:MAG TPA: glycosyltransferase family A protein [bacterium]|nr:glycosyltransferase family A protein [bacterium]HPV65260.1 glycosyltransferase family A protein [bacterium]